MKSQSCLWRRGQEVGFQGVRIKGQEVITDQRLLVLLRGRILCLSSDTA